MSRLHDTRALLVPAFEAGLGIEVEPHAVPFTIDLGAVQACRPESDGSEVVPGRTSVRFKNGDTVILAEDYASFRAAWAAYLAA